MEKRNKFNNIVPILSENRIKVGADHDPESLAPFYIVNSLILDFIKNCYLCVFS